LGIDCHEPPDNSSVCKIIAEPGMVFSVEPGIYLKDRLGVRIEDLVLVTKTGCEVLNHYTKELQIIK
jgi:Xaa-Pro dipeptidase